MPSRYPLRMWARLLGAVCPERNLGAGRDPLLANTLAMNLHLVEISEAVAPGVHAALIPDGAGRHVADKLTVLDNDSLVDLPPYAPEPNLIENARADLRITKLAYHLPEIYIRNIHASCRKLKLLLRTR